MYLNMETTLIQAWSDESFNNLLDNKLMNLHQRIIIDIKFSTAIDSQERVHYSALIIYKSKN